MSGDGTVNGVSYQARVIAGIYVRILAQSPLGWFSQGNDTPTAVSGETKGPGDDARIEFGGRFETSELQAKYGLNAAAELDEVLSKIRELSGTTTMPVALVLDESSTSRLYREFATDLERLRSGRDDDLRVDARRLHQADETRDLLTRLYVIRTDLDDPHDAGMEMALHLLSSVLEDKNQTNAAWDVLAQDAMRICSKKLRRNRESLINEVLSSKGIAIRPPDKDQIYIRQIDFVRGLLAKRQAQVALVVLRQLAADLDRAANVDPNVHYQAAMLRAGAHLQLGQPSDGLAAARLALDIEPKGVRALSLASRCQTLLGDLASAKTFADRAITSDPDEIRAWIAALEVAAATGEAAPAAPEHVAIDKQYRLMLAESSVRHGDWDHALESTAGLLHDSDRSPEVLVLRAIALADRPLGESQDEPWEEVDRLTTEAMSALDESDPLIVQALVLRSAARMRSNRTDEAAADIEHARLLDSDNPEVLRHAVEARLRTRDRGGALQLLWSPVVDKDSRLRALRGGLRLSMDDSEGSTDLKAALALIPNADDPDSIRMIVSEAALNAGDFELAEQALDSLTAEAKVSWNEAYIRGNLLFARGQVEAGSTLLREAARRTTKRASFVLVSLAEQLLRAGRPDESVQAFDEVDRSALSAEDLPMFVQALMQTGDFERSQQIIDELAKQSPLPQWAVEAATDLAFRREEPEAAIRGLQELIARGSRSTRISIVLAKALIDVDRLPEASACVDELLKTPDLNPIELMQAAELLYGVGRGREAVEVGFRAFRGKSGNPDIQRSFATVLFMGGGGVPPVDQVGPDTYVSFKRSDGQTREYVVYAEPPIDPLRNEITLEDAAAKGILGLRNGEEWIMNRGARTQERWTVESILPASVHAAQDIVAHYGDRFATQPFFVEQVPVGENLDNVAGMAQLIGLLGEQHEFQTAVIKMYREQMLPLGLIAQRLGCMIVELMSSASAEPEVSGPLVVEWADASGQARSIETARTCATAVLTRSGLETAYSLKLLEPLAASMTILVPRSLLDELRAELKEDKKRVDSGYSKLGAGGPAGLSMTDLPANHPGLLRRFEVVQEQLAWAESQRIEFRPLGSVRPVGSHEEETRGILGRSSYDALVLAQPPDVALYADDLGLRKLALAGSPAPSFSTVSLLVALAERGLISGDERDQNLLRLVRGNYVFVPPTSELLDLAVRQEPVNGAISLRQTFAILGSQSITAHEAARIAITVVKAAALRSIQTVSIDSLTEMALQAMAMRWQMPLCISLVSQEAGEQLRLLPQHQEAVRGTCAKLRSH